MLHNSFYNVSENCYLFDRKTGPEEQVRQWVLFELIRYYGYSIEQIKIEKSVQYGTRRGFIDIIIYLNDKPFIIIECKRQTGYSKSKDHMKQAISYANADSIQAEFCVFTDGNIWQVKRKTAAGWVNYPNIPKLKNNDQTEFKYSILLHDLDEIKPVLHWLYQPISGENVVNFTKSIQVIFYANSIITTGTNRTLLDIIDYVCRGINIKPKINGYHLGKLTIAYKKIQIYLKEVGIKNHYGDCFENDLHELLMIPDMQFNELTETLTEFDSEMDHAAIHLISALYSEARSIVEHRSTKELTLSSELTDQLYNFINLGLQRNLQTSLPKKSDSISVNDIRESCTQNWQKQTEVYQANLVEVASYYFGRLKAKLTK